MLALLLETSTERGLLAICKGQQLLFARELAMGYQNSQNLFPAIAQIFEEASCRPDQLSYIAVGIGPGSYTGLRVGVATAKGIAFAHQTPLIGISTLKLYLPSTPGPYTALIDAKMGGAYFLHGMGSEATAPQVLPLEQLGILLEEKRCLVTPRIQPLRSRLEALFPDKSWIWEESAPSPQRMATLAQESFEKKEFALDGKLDLLYLR